MTDGWMCMNLSPIVNKKKLNKKTQSCAKYFPLHKTHQSHPHETLQVFKAPPPAKFLSRCSLLAESMKMAAITGNLDRLLCLLAALTSCWLVVWLGDGVCHWERPLWLTEMKARLCFARPGGRERTGENHRPWIFKGKPVGWCFHSV